MFGNSNGVCAWFVFVCGCCCLFFVYLFFLQFFGGTLGASGVAFITQTLRDTNFKSYVIVFSSEAFFTADSLNKTRSTQAHAQDMHLEWE